MDVLQQDFHEDDAYDRDCTAFKVRREAVNTATLWLFINLRFSILDSHTKGTVVIGLCCFGFTLRKECQLSHSTHRGSMQSSQSDPDLCYH